MRTPVARLDAGALRHNLARARAAAPGCPVFTAIKAEGYGHGLLWCAAALAADCEGFAVAAVGEGVALRDAGFREHRICILNGPVDADDLRACAAHALEPLIHQPWQAEALAEGRLEGPLSVWLKIDSGMGRMGVPARAAADWHRRLAACADVAAPVGLMTHLACADDRTDGFTERQLDCFEAAIEGCAGPRSAANSAGVLGWPRSHCDWIRPGIMLYGCSPFVDGAESALDLRPVMTLSTRLIAINHLEAGSSIGYGRGWTCPDDMPVGVAAIGYGDGYPRHARNGTPVLVAGQRVPMVGRVSMDKITLDLRSLPEARVGDEVVLWGEGLPIEEIAEAAATIGYELLCGVHGRVPMHEAGR
ncbi:MAG: alanine racemase [Halofilum sp. (in: g-proteobacteria)]|nr:alanine racemase [Halofilum sp. (in: g-proteobacteria)]